MRQVAMAVLVVVAAAGCGDDDDGFQAWDKNRDGVIAQCEGLNRMACGVTPGCQGQELACILICRDNGKGGCLPCDDFQCNPTQPKPPPPNPNPDCALIPVGACSLVPACEVQDITVCSVEPDHGIGNSDPLKGCFPDCTTTQICVNRAPESCDGLEADACTANPSCELQNGPVCEIACLQGQDCPPCATPSPICVKKPSHCETKSISECLPSDGCMIESFACPAICEDDGNGGCLPCPAPPARCVDIIVAQPEPADAPPPVK